MSPPGPPPPPGYGPERPRHGREEMPIGKTGTGGGGSSKPSTKPPLAESLDEIVEAFKQCTDELRSRNEKSDVMNGETARMRLEFNQWREEQKRERQRESEEREAKRKIAETRRNAEAARARFWRRMGVIAGVVATLLISVWKTFEALQPDPVEEVAADVQETVESRTSALELEVKANSHRVTKIESEVKHLGTETERQRLQLLEGIGYLGRKLDEVSPKARKVPRPKSVTDAEETLEKQRQQKRKQEQRERALWILDGNAKATGGQ